MCHYLINTNKWRFKKMLDLEQIREKLESRNIAFVARELKMCYLTLANIANGTTRNPGYNKVKALSDYLEEKNG